MQNKIKLLFRRKHLLYPAKTEKFIQILLAFLIRLNNILKLPRVLEIDNFFFLPIS